jgi:hypothetical protein
MSREIGRTDEKRKNAGDALAERLVPNGIVSIDLDSGQLVEGDGIPPFAIRRAAEDVRRLEPGESELILLAEA